MVNSLPFALVEDGNDVVEEPRLEIVGVHPAVHTPRMRIVWERAVAMAKKVIGTVMAFVPDAHRVMATGNLNLFFLFMGYFEFEDVSNLLKSFGLPVGQALRCGVVIAPNDMQILCDQPVEPVG